VLIHDEGNHVEAIFADELEFQFALHEAMTPELEAIRDSPNRVSAIAGFTRSEMDEAIGTLEVSLRTLL
jgi:hypothetical protein